MVYVNYLLFLLDKIPASFWGVLVGSGVSLAGVIISNTATDRRLREQREAERVQKKHERELVLKKEIYIAAAEAFTAGITSLNRIANLGISDEKVSEPFIEKSPSIAKIHVIASESTVEKVANLSGEMAASFVNLLAKRTSLLMQKSSIDLITKLMDEHSAERNKNFELIKQYNLDGKNDPRRWDVLNKNYAFERDRVEEALKEREPLMADLTLNQMELGKECVVESARLSHLYVPTLIAMRDELELPIDGIRYGAINDAIWEKQIKLMNDFVEKLKQELVQLA